MPGAPEKHQAKSGPCEVPTPTITPLEWELLKRAWSDDWLEVSGLADSMTDVFDEWVDDYDIDDAIEHLVDRGMLYRKRGKDEYGDDETRYMITNYGKKQLYPDITGKRGGGTYHIMDVEALLYFFRDLGYFTHADRGFGGRKADILLLAPKGPYEWDLEHPIGVEVEWKPGKHRDRVRENVEKARWMPIFFCTRKMRWRRTIEELAREAGARVVIISEPGVGEAAAALTKFFRRWEPNTIAVYASERTPTEVFEKTFALKREGYHFRIRDRRYLYAKKKVGGRTEEVYVGKIFDDFKERVENKLMFDETGEKLLRPVVLEKTIKWAEV